MGSFAQAASFRGRKMTPMPTLWEEDETVEPAVSKYALPMPYDKDADTVATMMPRLDFDVYIDRFLGEDPKKLAASELEGSNERYRLKIFRKDRKMRIAKERAFYAHPRTMAETDLLNSRVRAAVARADLEELWREED